MGLQKLLWILSGDDVNILNRCTRKRQIIFAAIGALVGFIFILCFVSSYFAFSKLFNTYFIGLILAIFIAALFTNMYLLILYTLSKNVLPHNTDLGTDYLSKIIRWSFIAVIALLVSKPLELLIFSATINDEVTVYKIEMIKKYETLIDNQYSIESTKIQDEIEGQIKLFGNPDSETVLTLKSELGQIQSNQDLQKTILREKVAKSNYFIQSISILHEKYPTTWIITLLCTIIFMLPSVLKHLVSINTRYYNFKREIEVGLILNEYKKFKIIYQEIFLKKFNTTKTFQELYLNPPFNTRKKVDPTVYRKEEALISELYNA